MTGPTRLTIGRLVLVVVLVGSVLAGTGAGVAAAPTDPTVDGTNTEVLTGARSLAAVSDSPGPPFSVAHPFPGGAFGVAAEEEELVQM